MITKLEFLVLQCYELTELYLFSVRFQPISFASSLINIFLHLLIFLRFIYSSL